MSRTLPERDTTSGDISRLAKILGNIVAPTTAITALLFYFGWAHAYWFFHYLGVNSTVLGLSTADYLMRSLDGLFVPVLSLAVVGLVALWASVLWRSRVRPGTSAQLHRAMVRAVPIIGAALALYGLSRLFWEGRLNDALGIAPLSLAGGVLLLAWAVRNRRTETRARDDGGHPQWAALLEWAAVFLLVGLCLFWAATDYSAAVGTSRARELIAELSTEPNVVLYSERSLSLDAPGVREIRCADDDAAYLYRYDGVKLIWQSDDQYVLLPTAWERSNGVAIVMPRQATLRLEFMPVSTGPGPTC
jgi:hypothetical protein